MKLTCKNFAVAPRVGAWIETVCRLVKNVYPMSHPVWVRGLKPDDTFDIVLRDEVAPRVGAWIETSVNRLAMSDELVAPRVGAWIETKRP